MEQTHALGRRKAAVARVYVTAGAGNITINDRPLENYFALESLRYIVNQPLEVTGTLGQFDVKVTVVGGGVKGQAEAIRLGIARALSEIDRSLPFSPEGRRIPHPRFPRGRAQEARPARRTPSLPVQQALIAAGLLLQHRSGLKPSAYAS